MKRPTSRLSNKQRQFGVRRTVPVVERASLARPTLRIKAKATADRTSASSVESLFSLAVCRVRLRSGTIGLAYLASEQGAPARAKRKSCSSSSGLVYLVGHESKTSVLASCSVPGDASFYFVSESRGRRPG